MGPIPRISEALEPFVPCESSLALSGFGTVSRHGNGRSTGACVMPSVNRRHVVMLSEPVRVDVDEPSRRLRGEVGMDWSRLSVK